MAANERVMPELKKLGDLYGSVKLRGPHPALLENDWVVVASQKEERSGLALFLVVRKDMYGAEPFDARPLTTELIAHFVEHLGIGHVVRMDGPNLS